jgi:NAD(P)-dependent dehydrogenase (short-subunit alcohol dehydrogenase family)
VHLWTVTPDDAAGFEHDDRLAATLDLGFYSLIALAQALGDLGSEPCQITVVSNGLHDVTGSDRLSPEKATVAGPCKVIPQEYANLKCRSIDIILPQSHAHADELVDRIVEELSTEITDGIVALRGVHRWVQFFEPVRINGTGAHGDRLRIGGVYLITGGLGGIGLAMAEYLARTVRAKLVLIGRSTLPHRHEWAQILAAHGDVEGIGRKIRKVQTLEELGAEVLVAGADVADRVQMEAVVQQAVARFGAIHGVIHAAGVPPSGLIQLKTPEMAARVLAPKVMGTLVLERVMQEIPLDFLALFSSMSAITSGGPGQVDYCAANAFMDAYAQRHFAEHGMTVAIGWGEWQWDAWEEGLLGFPEEAQLYFKQKRREFGIRFEEGSEALRRTLSRKLPHVVVATQDFPSMLERSKSFSISTIIERVKQQRRAQPSYPRPALATSYVAPGSEVERKIAAIWTDLLGIAQIGIHDNFFELGGNSLLGIDLIARMRKDLDVETIPTHVLYEAPTISALAQFLAPTQQEAELAEEWQDRGEKRREKLKQFKHRVHLEA